VGSYGPGITIYQRDGSRLRKVGEAPGADSSFLVADRARDRLYACNELTEQTVTSYAIESDGALRELNSQPTGGALPCHLLLHPAGYLLTANYGAGSVAVHPVRPDGSLGERTDLVQHEGHGQDPDRQAGPHAHQVKLISGVIAVVDLGLDQIIGYRLEPDTGKLTRVTTPLGETQPGAGPRHLTAHPSGRWYVADELGSTVSVFEPDFGLGTLRLASSVPASHADTSSSPDQRNYPAGIALSADGRFLYLSNRGADTIATFSVGENGELTRLAEIPCGGNWPRHFAIVDDLLLVANERSHAVTGFQVDPGTAALTPLGVLAEIGSPTCVLPM
jgi:6-phosphogluconolactonase (cycloisomerase 2 family)